MNRPKRGPGKPKKGTYTPVRNITMDAESAEAFNQFKERLEKHLGFRMKLGQAMQWLIRNADKIVIPDAPSQERK